jgi:Leucine-rich repeat (LRR) protein
MKKLYFLITVFCSIGIANAQIINIPDSYFKQKLLEASPTNTIAKDLSGNYFKIDTNNDREIQVSEALNVSYLNVYGSYVGSMTGLSYFTNIKYLSCCANHIEVLDLTGLSSLTDVYCCDNQLTSLNLTGLTNLKNLQCYQNHLTSLDLTGFPQLADLQCGSNDLTSLNVTGLSNLKNLECESNQLTSLNVSNLPALEFLYCGSNLLTSLNLNGAVNLKKLSLYFNRLETLDLTGLVNLLEINASNNLFTTLNLNGLTNLKSFSCCYGQLTSLDISGLNNLFDIHCYYNQITSLNLNALPALRMLKCNNNQLPFLNVNGLSNLYTLDCSINQLTTLDISSLTQLNQIVCHSNQLGSLNLNGLTNLQSLDCGYNQLPSLNLGGLTNLSSLICTDNHITSLDFTDNDIWNLYCSGNQLTTLDLSNETNLRQLFCEHNQLLTSLFIKNGNNEPGLYFSDNPNLSFICADEGQITHVQDKISEYGYSDCHVNSYCSFSPGGTFYTIQGNNRYDEDNNGCSVADQQYPNLKLQIANGTNTVNMVCNESGAYHYDVQSGTYSITPVLENPSYFTVSPSNATVTFPTQASPFTQNFCITPNGSHPDLEISLLPIEVSRPGFDAIYKIIYKNKGNITQSGTVNLNFNDAVLDLVSASPTETTQTVNNISWNFANLLPFETREISFTLNVNSPMETPPVNGGDVLTYTATIVSAATDETPSDNTFVLNQTVVNSFDPNDKTCLEGTTITPDKAGEYIHYMIRFENTGTYPAQNIVVKDMIDTNKFDISSLVPMNGSHSFVTKVSEGNKVEFIFENINLPFDDANNDGYVAFKIKTVPTLVNGDTFSNTASIYFDYNFPIVTNTATTTITALKNQDFEFSNYFKLYPNPVQHVLNIDVKETIAISSVSIYNTLGQLVLVVPNAQNTKAINVSNLTAGNYFIKINTDKGTSNTKFIKQ